MLADIEKETVDFIPNFDQTAKSRSCLPSRIPNLLVNGASGIAVGMATNIPPHNLSEIIEAAVLLIEKPDTTLKEMMKLVPGPDFPTGGYISGREGIEQAYKTGRGSFIMRAKAAIEQVGKDRENIVITEIPYQVNKSRLIERIAELVQTKKIEGISDVRDESDRDGMRIVIEIKRGEEPQLILNHLFKLTQMQESFGMILLAIIGGQPREMGLLGAAAAVPRAPPRSGAAAHAIRPAQGRRARAHLARLPDRPRPRGQRHSNHPRFSSRAEARENLHDFFENKKSRSSIRQAAKRRKQLEGRQSSTGKKYGSPRAAAASRLPTPDRRHPGIAVAPPDAALGRRNPQGIAEIREQIAELKEILASEKKLKQVIITELREVQKEYGDDAPHADRGHRRGNQARRPDRRRGHGHHHQPRRLHQAHVRGRLSPPVARRQGPHRRENARRGFRRVSLRGLGAQLHSAVQLEGPRLLAEGLRNSRSRRSHARQGHLQPGEDSRRTST